MLLLASIISFLLASGAVSVGTSYQVSRPTLLSSRNNETDGGKCRSPAQWFTQPIDHYQRDNSTFRQKYYLTTDFYKPGGPILLFQGEESSELDCPESTILFDFARQLNAVVVVLEHRYFGQSKPFGSNVSQYTHEQWSHLTLDNVMQDAASFVQAVRQNVTGAQTAPIFAASGSYGGYLMTLFRQNHPEAFDGVIAAGGVFQGFYGGDVTSVPGEYNWWDFISQTYRDESFAAAHKIQQAFRALGDRFKQNNVDSLRDELGLCDPVTNNSLSTLNTFFQSFYGSATEFNYNVARPGRSSIANPLQVVIGIALNEADPMQLLRKTGFALSAPNAAGEGKGFTCLNYTSSAAVSVPLIEWEPFNYITCTYLAFNVVSVSNNTIFPPSGAPSELYAGARRYCQDRFGVSAPDPQTLYQKYHFTTAELQNSTGIMFSLGQYDPTTALSGALEFAMPDVFSQPYASRRFITSGMAHREDLFTWTKYTKETVRKTNLVELEILKTWAEIAKARRA